MESFHHHLLNDESLFVDDLTFREFKFDRLSSIDSSSRKRKLSQTSLTYLFDGYSHQNNDKHVYLGPNNINQSHVLTSEFFHISDRNTIFDFERSITENSICTNLQSQIFQDQQLSSNLNSFDNDANLTIKNMDKNDLQTNTSNIGCTKSSNGWSFEYNLAAATSSAMKTNEDSLTYLNQGQNYELKLRYFGEISALNSRTLKSVIRLCFYEKKLQQFEKNKIQSWQQSRKNERILEAISVLSYGVKYIKQPIDYINVVECYWDPTKTVGVFIKVNCISTEFTEKKSGGEKGIPFRIRIETYLENEYFELKKIHTAACQIKVFKMKGADRKHKQDRERISKRSYDDRISFQKSSDTTILTEIIDDDDNEIENSGNNEIVSSTKLSPTNSINLQQNNYEPFEEQLTENSSFESTQNWLQANRFENISHLLSNFSASDMFKLSRDDLIDICGKSEGIRLFNALNPRSKSTKLTIYIEKMPTNYEAIYLDTLDVDDFKRKLLYVLNDPKLNSNLEIFIIGPKNIKIILNSDVILHIDNETIFTVEFMENQLFLRELK